ncbi:MAG: class I SAM-dependent methyltransferase [Flammeovirgaceae bacterium]
MKSEKLKPGDAHYKAYVGSLKNYDVIGAMQFNLLTSLGLRESHKLLDIGCGSLRSGKLLIPYLKKGNYYGIEPNQWLIKEGIEHELGQGILHAKEPFFNDSAAFELSVFDEQFDFIVAQSIFTHTSKSQIKACFQEAKKVLKQNGLFVATFCVGNSDYTGDQWVYPSFIFYKHQTIISLAKAAGLSCRKMNWQHPGVQTWYVIYQPTAQAMVAKKLRPLFHVNKARLNLKKLGMRFPFLKKRWTKALYRKWKG